MSMADLNIRYEESVNDNNVDEEITSSSDIGQEEDDAQIDGRSYLIAHQAQEKWENLYPYASYSAAKHGWLCKICSEYSDGGNFWRTTGVKIDEHPGRVFSSHSNSIKHNKAVQKREEVQEILHAKGSIYKQMHDGKNAQNITKKRRKHRQEMFENNVLPCTEKGGPSVKLFLM